MTGAVFSALNLFAIYWFASWETIPFHFLWISLTLLYGFRSWPTSPTMWILGAVMVTTASGIGLALDALIENAVRHTGSDGDIQLSVIRDYPGMLVWVVVADTGTGIPADQLPFIFDRFCTSDGGQSPGTGLGLPLVRAVARAHGGDVTVSSKEGAGSEFELSLPAPVRSALPAAQADEMTGEGSTTR